MIFNQDKSESVKFVWFESHTERQNFYGFTVVTKKKKKKKKKKFILIVKIFWGVFLSVYTYYMIVFII